MYEELFPERLAKLREARKISAREMSLAIGKNENYINRIENRKTYPSMQVFFRICEYLEVTPQEFFQTNHAQKGGNPVQDGCDPVFAGYIKRLTPNQTSIVTTLVEELVNKQ